ncbi:hypothetical protein HBI65_175650 [Parastagonospora nodorum]|nr:hypothetical protein HBH52_220650 [Parastagonospora nodorum]KAH4978686.1 hypothetical protein HBI76_205760 [Parastagonospora nodorum]KAH5687104.1 hypothetical protein HBI44_198010 [Parastagonospora nodorum]KAH6007331.1 hypothetical protein HBI83_183230 [Parastagonospora nodorum]KAH6033381.1 hypothetical protein HBI54_206290 [Parastagonospora nodorum]
MSCTSTPITAPPTTLTSCAVPIGGSNSSILDTCCNGHINAMATYSAPGSSSNARSGNGCFQFCVTDDPDFVSGCLTNTLGEYEKDTLNFECFNVGSAKKDRSASGGAYESGGERVAVRWSVTVFLGLGFVGAVLGSL